MAADQRKPGRDFETGEQIKRGNTWYVIESLADRAGSEVRRVTGTAAGRKHVFAVFRDLEYPARSAPSSP
jgi:hypothetical protein